MGVGEGKKGMTKSNKFTSMRRQEFRKYFQPSRILLGVMPAPTRSGLNVITLCFSMHCSYKPPMIAIAIQDVNASYEFIQRTDQYVLSVPGTSMVRETLYCGTKSANEVDKVEELSLDLIQGDSIGVPGLNMSIANIEMVKEHSIRAGDHILVVGRAVAFRVNQDGNQLPLLSVGPETRGYRILAQNGIHRIGTVEV